jgi:hypothetical protein
MHASNRLHKFFPFPTVLPDPDPDPTCFASPSQTSKKQQQWTAVGELLMVTVMSIYNQDGGLDAKCRPDAGIGAKYREFPTKMHSFKVQT